MFIFNILYPTWKYLIRESPHATPPLAIDPFLGPCY